MNKFRRCNNKIRDISNDVLPAINNNNHIMVDIVWNEIWKNYDEILDIKAHVLDNLRVELDNEQ